MNAKLKVFTNRAALVTVALWALSVRAASAQTAYDKIQDNSFWNDGRNISGIRNGTPVKASYAELHGGMNG